MEKFCIAKVDLARHIHFGESKFFAKLKSGAYGWVDCMLDDGVVWYDDLEEARRNLLDDDECIISHSFDGIAAKAAKQTAEKNPDEPAKPSLVIPMPAKGKGSKYDLMLEDFVNSGEAIREITDFGGVTGSSLVRGLRRYIELGKYPVGCIHTFDRVYLVREGTEEYKMRVEQKSPTNRRNRRTTFLAAMVGTI